jgi:hypothetical protein
VRKLLCIVAVLVVVPSVVRAEEETVPEFNPDMLRTYVTTKHNRGSGMIGLHLDRPSRLLQPHGISLDLDGKPVWDTCAIDFEWPDLVLAYSHTLKADNLRMRSDTAQLELGQRAGHPITPFQFHLTAGNPKEPLGGMAIATHDHQFSIYLYNRARPSKRTNLNFFNLFSWGTDSTTTGTPDFWLHNYQTKNKPIHVSADDQVSVNGALAHTGAAAGFFGAQPTTRPVITGSRSDGTALTNLLTELTKLGLIEDQTTP